MAFGSENLAVLTAIILLSFEAGGEMSKVQKCWKVHNVAFAR